MNTDLYILIICAIVFFSLLGTGVILFVKLYQQQYIGNIRKQQQLQSQFQQTLLQSQLEIQEQTLHKISQEIHDNIGQVLSLTKLNLNTMDLNQPETAGQKLQDSRQLVSKAIQDLRDLSKSLNSDYVTELGLLRAIEYELEMIGKTGSLATQLDVTGTPVRLDAQKELILFRIVQEAINNIIKHAAATRLNVSVAYSTGSFVIALADNGKGFDSSLLITGNKKTGLGLRNMHNRSRLIGADVSITSKPGAGTTVTLSLLH